MKKMLTGMVLAAAMVTGLWAEGARETVKVEGKLAVTDSIPTIVANGKTWVLPMGPFYQVAWENNVKLGDTIKVEGFEAPCPADFEIKDAKVLMPTKVWVNGKEIDLSTFRDRGMRGGFGRGRMMDDDFEGCGDRGGRGGRGGRGRDFDDARGR